MIVFFLFLNMLEYQKEKIMGNKKSILIVQ